MNDNYLHLLNYQQAANYIGIHPVTLRRWVSERRVPCVRVAGSTVRFRVEDIESMLNVQEVVHAK